jgi:hypothetical protein
MACPVVSGGLIYMYYHIYKVIRLGDMVMVFSSLKNNTGIVSAMLFFCTRYGSSDPIQINVCRFHMPRISNIQRFKTPNKADRTLTSRWFSQIYLFLAGKQKRK